MTLTLGRRRERIRFQTDLAVLSTDLIACVNEFIAPTGHEYAFITNGYCFGYLVLLSTREKRRLASQRAWSYWSPPIEA